jgi:LmbE family N-acetylglucosaminyl deacetylase
MTTILVVSAHPDDETLFSGGTLARYAQKGHDIFILETTRGEGGEVGEPPLTTRENLAAFREQEVRKAAGILGARDIFFLPYIDPFMEINGIARRIDAPLADFAAAIAAYAQKIDPQLVITHGSNGEYGHPQHVYTHRATRMALNTARKGTAFMTWSAWHTPSAYERILNQDDQADIISDISPWHDIKVAAALCHQTQHAMFLRNSGAPSVADMVRKTETFHIWRGPLPQDLQDGENYVYSASD